MVDGHTLFDYNVGLNEIVQILIKAPAPVIAENSAATDTEVNEGDAPALNEQEVTTTNYSKLE